MEMVSTMRRTANKGTFEVIYNDDHNGSTSASALFATGSVSAGSVASSSVPNTTPSESQTVHLSTSFELPSPAQTYYHYSTSSAQQVHSTPTFDPATNKSPLRFEDEEEEDDEIVLGYTPNRLGLAAQHSSSAFSAQRSTILKIYALTGLDSTLPALLHPSHHPRSLWTLASHQESNEPFVWAIFDSHEHALAALQAVHNPTVEPALESDLHPFSKLRKVDMKAWTARATAALSYNPVQSVQSYSPTDAYSQTNNFSRESAYPLALYYQSTHHHSHSHYNHTHTDDDEQSKYDQQEINTPIPLPVQPQPHPKFTPDLCTDGDGAPEHEDHSTPIPPSCMPVAQAPALPAAAASPNSNTSPENLNASPTTSEMKESRNHRIDPDSTTDRGDGGVELDGGNAVSLGGGRVTVSAGTPPPSVLVAGGRHGPVTRNEGGDLVTGNDSGGLVTQTRNAGGGLVSGNDVDGPVTYNGADGEARSHTLKGQFGTRDQGHAQAHASWDVEEVDGTLERKSDVPAPWNLKRGEDNLASSVSSALDRQFDVAREESQANFAPAPSSSSASSMAPFSSASFFHTPREDIEEGSSSKFTNQRQHRVSPHHLVDSIGLVGGGAKTIVHSGHSGTARESDSIAKMEGTATEGDCPLQNPAPAETSFSPPLPYYRDDRDRDGADERRTRLLYPDHAFSSFVAPLSYDGDHIRPNPSTASIASRDGAPLRHGDGRSPSSLDRFFFSPLLGRPIQSRDVAADWGDDGCGGENGDEMLRGGAPPNLSVEDGNTVQSSVLPRSQQFPLRELQKQPFLHELPPHSLSFFHQGHQHQHQQQAQLQQQQHIYHSTDYAHTNLGIATPNAFRHGDWLCNMAGCGAHNFGRNVSCIMCGAVRATATATGAGLGFEFAAAPGTAGAGRMHSSGGTTLSMGMGMAVDVDSDIDVYSLDGSRLQGGLSASSGQGRLPTNGGSNSNAFSPQAYSSGHLSTFIPVIPRQQHRNGGLPPPPPPQTTTGDLAMNSTLVQALGGISQVAAIQEAIKAHQSQTQSQVQDGRGRLSGANNVGFPGQRLGGRGELGGSVPAQGGQLLIPTTLGNSPPASLQQGPVVVQQDRGARFGEARNGSIADDRRGRNLTLTTTGMQNNGLSPVSSQFSPQGHPMQPNHPLQHPLPPHPGISASLLNAFSPASAALASIPPSKMPALLTPSGRKFATGGRVQNISRDELNPIHMFWPDNEPLPLTSQIRPPAAVLMALGGVQGPPPPILNTGNKGPIDAQPGDWTCGKCDYLNWRRRRVCANCYPHAEGNTEGTKHSTNDVERVALLASVIFQQQQQVQAQQRQIQSQQATVAAFASSQPESNAQSRNTFSPGSFASHAGALSGMASQQQSYAEAPRRNDSAPSSKVDLMPMQFLAQKYGYAVPPPNGLRSLNSTSSVEHAPLPLNLPPRMIHPSVSDGMVSRGFMDFNRNAPSFQPSRVDGVPHFDGVPQRLRSSPPSSRSSFSIGSNSSFYKSTNEPTPSPLPLLPAFLQEVVGETSESSSSSVHESPSPPSPSSTSSAFGNTYSNDPRLSELVGAGLRRREESPASGPPQISNNIHRTASHSSIWSFGYPGDRKEGIRPI